MREHALSLTLASALAASHPIRDASSAVRPLRILVVEDELSLRHAVARGLEKAGHSCLAVGTAREGLDAFAKGGFDGVLTDIRLPDLSGLDIVAVLTEKDPYVPILVMTGVGSMDVALDALRRGARDYVEKPFVVQEVIARLERAVAEPREDDLKRKLRARVERRLEPERFGAVERELREDASAGDPASNALSSPSSVAGQSAKPVKPAKPAPLDEARQTFEIAYVEDLLARTGGNVAAAARLAGISRPNFHKKLRTLGVVAERFKAAARRGRRGGATGA